MARKLPQFIENLPLWDSITLSDSGIKTQFRIRNQKLAFNLLFIKEVRIVIL
jgi:hypothetical protein